MNGIDFPRWKRFATGGRKPFAWFRQTPVRRIALVLIFAVIVLGTLNVSFHIALDRVRQSEHQMDLATASMMQGEYDDALDHYTRALDLNHRKRQAWLGKGLALMYLKRYDESLASYERLIRLDPDNALAWQGKGMSLGFMGKYKEAIASYDQALKIDPGSQFIEIQRERLRSGQTP